MEFTAIFTLAFLPLPAVSFFLFFYLITFNQLLPHALFKSLASYGLA